MKGKKGKKSKGPKPESRYIKHQELKPDLIPKVGDVLKALKLARKEERDKIQDLDTKFLYFDYEIQASSGGVIQEVLSNNPNNSVTYWPILHENYDQYRVLGIKMEFEPYAISGSGTASSPVVRTPIYVCTDYDDSTALTSYQVAETYSDCQKFRPGTKWTKIACDPTVLGAQFNDVIDSAPNDSFWMKIYSSGNTASLKVGRVIVTYVVQMKGRTGVLSGMIKEMDRKRIERENNNITPKEEKEKVTDRRSLPVKNSASSFSTIKETI